MSDVISANTKLGEQFTFGSFEQGNGVAPIEWLLIDIQDGIGLAVSLYGLDCRPYDDGSGGSLWEKCSLRAWLNTEFFNNAFTEKERERIELSRVVNEINSEMLTVGGNTTYDRVFLLSYREARTLFKSNESRRCKPTAYAASRGADTEGYEGRCVWWLRSPGSGILIPDNAMDVDGYGEFSDIGEPVTTEWECVRPAIRIRL